MLRSLDSRRSIPARQLDAPGPDAATLARMLRAAVRVPDHGRRVPFRFLRIAGPARACLGEALTAIARHRDPDASQAVLDKDRERFNHAPLVIAVIAVLDASDDKIPAQERLLSAGCVCFALLQAAQGHGFGAQWLTGWPAYDRQVHALLGVGEEERVAGFIHIGTPRADAPERERPDPLALLSDWSPA
ncbi:nitroreductase family protein [Luteimonas endophytica]|uniref:nitroreductase family protein n=1 Tax=Luteimonas endophytica TaxID=3042023 RepID=UPI003CE5981C